MSHPSSSHAPRIIEADVIARVHALLSEPADAQRSTGRRGRSRIVLVGEPGNGARSTLQHGILPRLDASPVRVHAEWDPAAAVQWCAAAIDAPLGPPPVGTPRVLLVACTSVAELPEWLIADLGTGTELFTVGTLSLAETHDFLESRLGGMVDLTSARTLGRAAGFVPGTLAWLAEESRRIGVIERVDEVWQLLGDPVRLAIAPRVRSRILAGGGPLATVATRIALAGSLPESACDPEEAHALGPLLQQGVLGRDARGELRFRAAGVTHTLCESAPEAVAATEHRRALDGERPGTRAMLWGLRGGVPAAELPEERVDRAIFGAFAAHEWLDAIALAEAAVGALRRAGADETELPSDSAGTVERIEPDGRSTRSAVREARLRMLAAHAARFAPDHERAHLHLEESAKRLDGLDGGEARAARLQLAVQRAGLLHFCDGDPDGALSALDDFEASESADLGEDGTAELVARRATHLCFSGRAREAEELLAAHRNFRARLQPGLGENLRVHEALIQVQLGDPQRALRSLMAFAAELSASQRQNSWVQEELLAATVVAALASDGPSRLPGLAKQLLQEASDDHYRPDLASYFQSRASWRLADGAVHDARRDARLALAAAELVDPSGFEAGVLALSAEATALLGESDAAGRLLSRGERTPLRVTGALEGPLLAQLGAARLALGLPGAGSWLLGEADRLLADGRTGSAAEVLTSGVRFGRRRAASALIRLDSRLEGPLHRLRVAHARAVLADDPVGLWAVSQQFAEAGLRLWAAEAAASTARLPGAPEALRRRAEARAQEYRESERLGSHPLLQLPGGASSADLTPREREISALIAAGLSNPEIAGRLGLSRRTVEGHIARLYRKTGEHRRQPGRRA